MTRIPCPLCRRRLAAEGLAACEPCRAHLTRQLAAIPPLLDRVRREYERAVHDVEAEYDAVTSPDADPINYVLPAGPTPAAPDGPINRRNGKANPPLPPGFAVGLLVDPMPNVVWQLTRWAPPRSINPIGWLAAHLDEFCALGGRQLVDLAYAIDRAVADLRRRTGDTRVRIGWCPVEGCAAELLAEPRARSVTCPGCGTAWARQHWLWLSDTLRAA